MTAGVTCGSYMLLASNDARAIEGHSSAHLIFRIQRILPMRHSLHDRQLLIATLLLDDELTLIVAPPSLAQLVRFQAAGRGRLAVTSDGARNDRSQSVNSLACHWTGTDQPVNHKDARVLQIMDLDTNLLSAPAGAAASSIDWSV